MVEDQERSAAVDRAYREHAQELYRLAFGILRDGDAAVDATQVAFARAYERGEQYDPSRPLLPWLHGIVAHEALDALRRRRVRWIAVAAMPDRERGVRSPGSDLAAEIAKLLGTSPGNVGSLLSRAHAQLRELLAELGPPPDARASRSTTTPLDE